MIATGHLSREQPLEAGDRIAIASRAGVVRDTEPLLGEHEFRLVAQLTRDESHGWSSAHCGGNCPRNLSPS